MDDKISIRFTNFDLAKEVADFRTANSSKVYGVAYFEGFDWLVLENTGLATKYMVYVAEAPDG